MPRLGDEVEERAPGDDGEPRREGRVERRIGSLGEVLGPSIFGSGDHLAPPAEAIADDSCPQEPSTPSLVVPHGGWTGWAFGRTAGEDGITASGGRRG
jgi:hypothetical protein